MPFFAFLFSVQPAEWLVAAEYTHSDVRTLEERPSVAQGGAHIREGRGPVLVTARDRPVSSEFNQYNSSTCVNSVVTVTTRKV